MPLALLRFEEDKNIQDKANFFADFFNHYNEYLGKFRYVELENLRSLCSKILFQLKHNREKCKSYIKSYLEHDQFRENGCTLSFKNFLRTKKELRKFIDTKGCNIQYSTENPKLLKLVNALSNELNRNQLSVAINFLIQYLSCSCKLEDHESDFIYLTQIIITELRFNKKSKKEIGSLIKKLLSKDEHKFHLPKKILQCRKQENYSEIVSKFFENRNLREQFFGIVNFNEKEGRKGYFLLKVENLILPIVKIISFGNISILNPNHKKFATLDLSEYKLSIWKNFTTTNDSILIIEGDISNNVEGFKTALDEAITSIRFINTTLNRDCQVNVYSYLVTSDFKYFGFSQTYDKRSRELTIDESNKLLTKNAFSALKENRSEAATEFLNAEKYYHRARESQEIPDYWLYLESIIPKNIEWKENGGYKSEPQIQETISLILRDFYLRKFKEHIADSIFHLVECHFNINGTKYSLSRSESKDIIDHSLPSRVIKKTNRFNHHPIINYLKKVYRQGLNEDLLVREYKYYEYVAKQIHCHRNSIVHGGLKSQYSEMSQKLIIDRYVETIRLYFLDEIKKTKRGNLQQIVRKIKKDCRRRYSNKLSKR